MAESYWVGPADGPPACHGAAVPSKVVVDLLAEDPTPYQAPTLTELEEAEAYAEIGRETLVGWLMTPEAPDFDDILAELVRPPLWHRQAACRGADPGLFFPKRGDGRPTAALAYCAECPVTAECCFSCRGARDGGGVGVHDRAGSPGPAAWGGVILRHNCVIGLFQVVSVSG